MHNKCVKSTVLPSLRVVLASANGLLVNCKWQQHSPWKDQPCSHFAFCSSWHGSSQRSMACAIYWGKNQFFSCCPSWPRHRILCYPVAFFTKWKIMALYVISAHLESGLLGLVLRSLSGMAWEWSLGPQLRWRFNRGTFDPIAWFFVPI